MVYTINTEILKHNLETKKGQIDLNRKPDSNVTLD
jgi:hypothetical protein